MSNNLQIHLKMTYQGKEFAASLDFPKEKQNTKCVSHEIWLIAHSAIRTLQKQGIIDESYFWTNESQTETIALTSSEVGSDK